jgi:hypothetical protein
MVTVPLRSVKNRFQIWERRLTVYLISEIEMFDWKNAMDTWL